ncbi:hypothetical protein BC937DRAFT_92926 [Endogone sp. FLAS-F59071]|nr:hypothetical protein BC937DRAFT_92926 [Endogone sp. FLAS-F59071]|eukprot:RUS21359.1 hypothetical protein BC937DRAFT_92926 [Endogone sp. FLAS-F59071]
MITPDEESTNRQLQEEERLALTSIFGDSAYVPDPRYPHTYILTLDLDDSFDSPPIRSSPRTLHIGLHMPSTYPSRESPLYEITSVYCGTMRVTDEMLRTVDEGFRARFVLGEVVVFEWAGWLREYFEKRFEEEEEAEQTDTGRRGAKVEMDEDTAEEGEKEISLLSKQEAEEMEGEDGGDSAAPPIAHGEPLTDRRSVFVAHAAPVTSVAEVQVRVDECMVVLADLRGGTPMLNMLYPTFIMQPKAVIRALYTNKRIARATHNIRAYRIVQSDGRILQDNDDDGETAAGGGLFWNIANWKPGMGIPGSNSV